MGLKREAFQTENALEAGSARRPGLFGGTRQERTLLEKNVTTSRQGKNGHSGMTRRAFGAEKGVFLVRHERKKPAAKVKIAGTARNEGDAHCTAAVLRQP